jgi:superfamily II DNA or RNA helicase
MKLRKYQIRLSNEIHAQFKKPGRHELVLALSPGGGKTVTAIDIITRALASGLAKRVLISAHGQKLLRSQFAQVLTNEERPFTWAEYKTRHRGKKFPTTQVVVALPQTLAYAKDIPDFDMLVVDEAHHFYLGHDGLTLQKLGKQAKRVLLLTGTPSKFVARGG